MSTSTTETVNKEPRKYRWLRRLVRTMAGILVFFILLLLFIRSPWGQDIITQQAIKYVSGKTGTAVAVEKLFITMDGNIMLNGLYLEDLAGDTLVYSNKLEAEVPLWPIISGDGIGIDEVNWSGLTARIKRQDTTAGFNYEFLVDAFATAPDTTAVSEPLNVSLGSFNLNNFDILYDDEVGEMNAVAQFENLDLAFNSFDINTMVIEVDNLQIDNATIKYSQDLVTSIALSEDDSAPNVDTTIAEAITDDANDSPLPILSAGSINLNDVFFNYESVPEHMSIKTDIDTFSTSIDKANVGQNNYVVPYFNLDNSTVAININESKKLQSLNSEPLISTAVQTASIEWPQFLIDIASIDLKNNKVTYTLNDKKITSGVLDPEAIQLTALNLKLKDVQLDGDSAGLNLERLSFSESAGISLSQLAFNAQVTKNKASLKAVVLKYDNSVINGNALATYKSLDDLINNYDQSYFDINLDPIRLDLNTITKFSPDLAANEYLQKASKNLVSGQIKVDGSFNRLNFSNTIINWGRETQLKLNGSLSNPTDMEQLAFGFSQLDFNTTKADINQFINTAELGIQIPQTIDLTSTASGSLKNMDLAVLLKTPKGKITLDSKIKNALKVPAYSGSIKTENVAIGYILDDPTYGDLDYAATFKGSGAALDNLDLTLDSEVNSFTYNNYEIKDLPLDAAFKNGAGTVTSDFKDDNLNAQLDSKILLNEDDTSATATINIVGVDLNAFGITSQNVKAAGTIDVLFHGDASDYEIASNITDGIAVYDNQSYLLGDVKLEAFAHQDTTSVSLHNRMIDLELRSNADPATLALSLQKHIDSYINDNQVLDSLDQVRMKLTTKITPSPMLRDVILPDLESMDTINVVMDYTARQHLLDTKINVPYIKYAGSVIDSLQINSFSNADNLSFDLKFKNIAAGPLDIHRTTFAGKLDAGELNMNFLSTYEDSIITQVTSTLSRKLNKNGQNDLSFKIALEGLILARKDWKIPNDNEITLGSDVFKFKNFVLTSGNQKVTLRDDFSKSNKEHVGLQFDNFQLQGLLSFLNPEHQLAIGEMNGTVIIENPLGATGFLADLDINKLHVVEQPLGKLTLDATSQEAGNYDLDLTITGDDIDLELAGDYVAQESSAVTDMELVIDKLGMDTVAGLSADLLKEGSGYVTGKFSVNGPLTDLSYNGEINTNDAQFNVSQLNTAFKLEDERITMDNEAINLNSLTILDANDNAIDVDGAIRIVDLLNPAFNLTVKATDFLALNSTVEDNELYYGKATIDANATITGDLNIPIIKGSLEVKDETDFYYVVPSTELDIVQRDGIVQFVNKKNPDAILTQTEEESVILTGFDIQADLKVNDKAKVNIIIDPLTNSELQVQGSGNLIFTMTPNGRMTLTGRYEVADGYYQMSLYEIVSRKFELVKGGSVSWSGDPFDANLDVQALYRIETSASALMASQSSGADAATKQRYRQELPFLVYLNVDGELMQPEISFKLDLPEDSQGIAGGQVYGRVRQLNGQEQELSKQVFSLLVLNKFFPTSGADGSNGGTATIARDNLNQALSDQLNQYGGKLLGNSGIDLNFGLDSYTDYQGSSPQERTQLDVTASKKLLDDRLIVSVGSQVDIEGSPQDGQEETPVIGNVSLEYLLNQAGQWRLRGFRRNQYDNVIDGQLIVSGISLIFTKEFNEFKDLFAKAVTDEVEKRKNNKEEKLDTEK